MTAYRSTTDEMLAARFDPKPWVTTWLDGLRTRTASQTHRGNAVFDPRPEFIEGRWVEILDHDGNPTGEFESIPRPEPNPILVALREGLCGVEEWLTAYDAYDAYGGTIAWDRPDHDYHALTYATDEQIKHARKVLTRLAVLA